MHAAAFSPRGGVSPRSARLRGQSIIEYVLIIAIIGLVVVFAGPQVSGAIRNQFNLVGNTVNNGTTGGSTGGGSEGGVSAAVQAAVAKDAKDWTLDEQKAAATDIAKNGTSSVVYAKAKAAMETGSEWSVKLTNGKTMTYRIVGINHDDLADGSGKAGLTFLTTSTDIQSRMNAIDTNAGGWEKSELRQKMNSGEIWNLMPADFQSKVRPVNKLTNNVTGTDKNAAVTTTSDKLFLLSYSEIVPTSYWASSFPWTFSEGAQYEAFKGKVTNNYSSNGWCLKNGVNWWERTVDPYGSSNFLFVSYSGNPACNHNPMNLRFVCPAFCF